MAAGGGGGRPPDDDDRSTSASKTHDCFAATAKPFAACGLDLPSLSNAIRSVAAAQRINGGHADTLAELIAEGAAALEANPRPLPAGPEAP